MHVHISVRTLYAFTISELEPLIEAALQARWVVIPMILLSLPPED